MEIDKSNFKNESGVYMTKSLFYETFGKGCNPVYTLGEEDLTLENGIRLISLKKRYLKEGDVLEHEFAKKYFLDVPHWEKICRTNWFKNHISQWRTELEIKLKTQVLKEIKQIASDPLDKNRFQALKTLYAHEWSPKRVGRPPKSKIKSDAIDNIYDEDMERLGLEVIEGGK